jgi:hypothetical protein
MRDPIVLNIRDGQRLAGDLFDLVLFFRFKKKRLMAGLGEQ